MAESDTPISGYAPDMLDRVLKQSNDSLTLMIGMLQLVTDYGSELPDMTNAVNLKTAADVADRLHKLLLSAAVAAEDGCQVSPSFVVNDDCDLETEEEVYEARARRLGADEELRAVLRYISHSPDSYDTIGLHNALVRREHRVAGVSSLPASPSDADTTPLDVPPLESDDD